MMIDYTQRLAQLRHQFDAYGVDGFIIPVNDEFQGEYVPDSARRLEWLTGFSGSNGVAVILREKAAFFTDGRYTLQAKKEVKSIEYQQFNLADLSPAAWAAEHLPQGHTLGYDPWLHTKPAISRYPHSKACTNLVDTIWHDRPAPPCTPIRLHPDKYTGETSISKRKKLAQFIGNHKAEAFLLTAPDSICWLLNIRGNDVPRTPFTLCFAIAYANGNVTLFADPRKAQGITLESVRIEPLESLEKELAGLTSCLSDPSDTSMWFINHLHGKLRECTDPCKLWKACKNPVEIEGMRNAHKRDAKAVIQFLHWLEEQTDVTETSASDTLQSFRAEQDLFQDLSFDTISGFGSNGAIVHYRASEKTNKKIAENGIYLLDSGGQYLDGTTDITRTISRGIPTPEQRDRFTRVLKGHIALACATFPAGTTGSQLDALARYALWQAGLDYDHGTGHGVGSYLSVHEGPQRISKMANNVALQPGMVISNEPGYYKAGEYGIRIESLVTVIERPDLSQNGKVFYAFETLTRVPLDLKLVDYSLLNADEKQWLEDYQAFCKKM